MKSGTIWKLVTGVGALLMVLSSIHAQDLEQDQPSYRVPKTPPKAEQPPTPEPLAETNAAPAVGGEDTELLGQLKGLVIVGSRNELKETPPAVQGLVVKNIPLLQGSDFEAVIRPYLGRPFTESTFHDHLAPAIIRYCRSKNHPIVDVIRPEQELNNKIGVVQLWFIEGKVGEVRVDNPGVKWFSDRRIRSQVRLQTGDSVDSKKLTEDLDWLNRNPFRQVNAQFAPSTNAFGESDVVLHVDDRIPLRPYVGYENSGTLRTGVGQLLAGLNWGNAFGLDQQLNYQYSTDTSFKKSGTDSGSYLIPLPWRHELAFYGSYVHVNTAPETDFNQKGQSYGASMRYTIPFPALGRYHQEVTVGFDYKSSNNNLEFTESGTNTPVSKTFVDVMQFQLGYTAVLPDALGQTTFVGEMYASPGGLDDHNTSDAFHVLRLGTDADYAYGRASLERVTRLPADFSWLLRLTGQLASGRLLPSEQMGFGGSGIRGYYTRTESGDEGFVVNNELRSPPISLFGRTTGIRLREATPQSLDQFQVLGFFDYGDSTVLDAAANKDEPGTSLYSVGGGVRYNIAPYLSIQADYGWELKRLADTPGSQASVSVLLSY